MHKISREKCAEIKNLLSRGLSIRKVAAQTQVSVGSISNIRKDLADDLPENCAGRPSLLRPRQLRLLFRAVMKPHVLSSRELADIILKSTGITMHPRTMRRILKGLGVVSRVRPIKARLLRGHKIARQKFAKKLKIYSQADFNKIMYTDECKFNRLGPDGPKRVWRRPGAPTQDHHFRRTVKYGGGSVMVWGAITSQGVGGLVRIPSTMDADVFCETLGAGLALTMAKHNLGIGDFVLQQDNDPKHVSKKAKAWISEHNIEVLPWPSCSPDLNPIENVWSDVKKRVYARDSKPNNDDELWYMVLEEWNNTSAAYITELYNSLPRRIKAVIKAKGSYTKY